MAPKKPPKVSTNDFLIAFGPRNSILARAPGISRADLLVSADLNDKIQNSKNINFIIFPPREESQVQAGAEIGNYFPETPQTEKSARSEDIDQGYADPRDPYVSYSKKGHMGDSKLFVPSDDYMPALTTFLKGRWGSGGLQVVGDGQGAWWGLSSSGSTQWTKNLPKDVRQLLKPYNPHGKVAHLALGMYESHIVLFEDGHVDWDLKNCYQKLDMELEIRSQGELIYVSLSAYSDRHFFAAFADATVLYEFPSGCGELDDDFLSLDNLRVVIPSETAKHTAIPVSKAPSAVGEFTKKVAVGVAEKTIESAIS